MRAAPAKTITAAPIVPALIDRGLAALGPHAWVMIQKYLDHLPLYRIEKISEQHGDGIARSTLPNRLGNWVLPCSHWSID